MSDLDKLMSKLKEKEVKVEEKPVGLEPIEELNGDEEFDDNEDDLEEEVEEISKPAQKPKVIPKVEDLKVKEPAQDKEVEDQNKLIDAEVSLLQNDGVFRRELLLTLKEKVDVQKAIAEILISINKELKK